MNPRYLLWISAPIALSAGVLWLSAQEPRGDNKAAAAEGDRSENAEYIYRKKELREIDRRIRYLQKRLPDLKVVAQLPGDQTRVFFGAWVTLEADDGQHVIYRIVGSDEFDPEKHWISLDAPMATALLKKAIDDEVAVETPNGTRSFVIVAVRYGDY